MKKNIRKRYLRCRNEVEKYISKIGRLLLKAQMLSDKRDIKIAEFDQILQEMNNNE